MFSGLGSSLAWFSSVVFSSPGLPVFFCVNPPDLLQNILYNRGTPICIEHWPRIKLGSSIFSQNLACKYMFAPS